MSQQNGIDAVRYPFNRPFTLKYLSNSNLIVSDGLVHSFIVLRKDKYLSDRRSVLRNNNIIVT